MSFCFFFAQRAKSSYMGKWLLKTPMSRTAAYVPLSLFIIEALIFIYVVNLLLHGHFVDNPYYI